jgi:hypothetical protein
MAPIHFLNSRRDEPDVALDPQEKADEDAVMESFLKRKPLDPEIARRVHERALAIRDRVFHKHGLVDIAVPAIRELRDDEP